ncbi:MAG: peptidoglycan binding domain-containing protein [Candidatus Kerfeldbacteria bacterium]
MRKKQKQTSIRLWVLATASFISVFFVVCAALLQGRILPGIRVANVPVGSLTVSQARERINENLTTLRFTLTYGSMSWKFSVANLGVSYDVDVPIKSAFDIGRRSGFTAFLNASVARKSLDVPVVWSEDALRNQLDQLVSTFGTLPQDAKLAYINGSFSIVPDESGTMIDPEPLQQQLMPTVTKGKAVTVAISPRPIAANVTAANLVGPQQEAEALLQRTVTFKARGKTFTPDRERIASWIIVKVMEGKGGRELASLGVRPKDGVVATVTLDEKGVTSYLESIASEVNVAPVPQEILVSTHKVEVIKQGVPGTMLAVQEASNRLRDAMLSGNDTVELPTVEVPFGITYLTPPPAPFPTGKAIGVDLTKQMEYDYENGILVYSTKISSGIHDWTPTGTFRVYSKIEKQKMSGRGYYVPNVPHILWFKGDYSIHGVYWHNDFGIRPRSHGCVGEPLDAAEWIFNWAEIGTPVVIYKS